MEWIALGIASRKHLESRNYERLNGKSEHGCYVMDSHGWVHTSKPSIYNYQQMGFPIKNGDKITIEHNPISKELIFISSQENTRFVLPVENDD